MDDHKTADKLLEMAKKMADEKLELEKQYVTEKINNEFGYVKKAIEMVQSGLCYVKEKEYGFVRYIFATEEMLIKDYLSEPENKYTTKGIRFNEERKNPWDYIFLVNGKYYYDMRYILQGYEQDVIKEKDRITRYNDELNQMIREFNRLLEEHKGIKRMLDDLEKRQA